MTTSIMATPLQFRLPQELLRHVFSYDNTYKNHFNKNVIPEIRTAAAQRKLKTAFIIAKKHVCGHGRDLASRPIVKYGDDIWLKLFGTVLPYEDSAIDRVRINICQNLSMHQLMSASPLGDMRGNFQIYLTLNSQNFCYIVHDNKKVLEIAVEHLDSEDCYIDAWAFTKPKHGGGINKDKRFLHKCIDAM